MHCGIGKLYAECARHGDLGIHLHANISADATRGVEPFPQRIARGRAHPHQHRRATPHLNAPADACAAAASAMYRTPPARRHMSSSTPASPSVPNSPDPAPSSTAPAQSGPPLLRRVLLRHTIAAHMLTCPCLEVAPCPRGPFDHEQLLLHERPVPNPGSALPCQPLHRPLLSEPVDTALAMHHRHRIAPE